MHCLKNKVVRYQLCVGHVEAIYIVKHCIGKISIVVSKYLTILLLKCIVHLHLIVCIHSCMSIYCNSVDIEVIPHFFTCRISPLYRSGFLLTEMEFLVFTLITVWTS